MFSVTLNMNGKSTNKAFDSQLIDLALINETVICKTRMTTSIKAKL